MQTKTEVAVQHTVEECEHLAKAIEGIAVAVQKLVGGPLTVRTLCLLIRDALPRGSRDVSVTDIQAVLEGACALGRRHLKAGRV